MTQVQTKTRNQKMEIQAFLNLTDGPLSYQEPRYALGDKSGSTTNS